MSVEAGNTDPSAVIRDHRRQWRRCLYVYPVISRRAKGLSIGVNLNPDKSCNFACVYCQIDRRVHRNLNEVDMTILHDELHLALEEALSGRLWQERRFLATPRELRRINDIALSGDGEPTCVSNFDKAVASAAQAKKQAGRDDIKLVVITNATRLDAPQFLRALPTLDKNNGEIWAKLDAGTDEYFRRVNRPHPLMDLRRIVDNIKSVARGRAIVIQSLFFRFDSLCPPDCEIASYIDRLKEILDAGGRIKLVQVHTVARPPAESFVSALPDARLDDIADRVRSAIPDVPVEAYYGHAAGS